MADTQSNIREKGNIKLQEPKRYNVILHNDDFTPMKFVVMMLSTIFHKNEAESEVLMMKVHKEGKAIAGTYSYDIALTKRNQGEKLARDNGHPLTLTVEMA